MKTCAGCYVGPANLHQVLTTVVEAAVQLSDPVTQKLCFAILRKLIEVWGASGGLLSSIQLLVVQEMYC